MIVSAIALHLLVKKKRSFFFVSVGGWLKRAIAIRQNRTQIGNTESSAGIFCAELKRLPTRHYAAEVLATWRKLWNRLQQHF
ncbi:MAG: hypothetical protein ACYTXI_17640 [Nostoc sp.]|uniref:Uncharacterized protein n=1 Tax=Nostoc punctiforme NIES-2108 TaxID=1356359 RepID=A0A367RE80_NOSPU|nr:hypothetical protein A6769_22240 [Nostoc punctiforme NIES-2108]